MRYVGLDVHKHSVHACVLDEAGCKVQTQDVACTREALATFAASVLRPDDRVALEATTNTWAVVDVLKPKVQSITVGNPLRTRAIAEAKIKTDKVDAEVLAQLLRCDYLPAVWEPDAFTRQLRRITGFRAALVSDRSRLKNRIRSALAQRLIEPPMAVLFTRAGLAWLQALPLPAEERVMVDSYVRVLESIEKELKQLDHQLCVLAHDDKQARLLMTLPGVSYETALTLVAALGDITRFRDGDHAASYLGLVPTTRQSAEHCHHGRITKAGNSQARWMLVQGMQHLATHPGPLGVFFRRLEHKKNRNVAVCAAARKIVTIAYLMLKHQEPYRYALPHVVQKKLAHVRVAATGVHRKGVRCKPVSTPAMKGKPRVACRPSLPAVYHAEGLPATNTIQELSAGERRILTRAGCTRFVRQIHDG